MGRFGAELILVFFAIFMILGIIVTYIIAIERGDVYPSLPYISDTGSYPPESCVFSFVLCTGAIIGFVILFIRYRHIESHYVYANNQVVLVKVHVLNILSFISGFISVVGLLVVGSFQNVNVSQVHFIGAFMIFLGGVGYSCLQTGLSYCLRKMHPEHVGCCIYSLRVIFSIVLFLSVICAVCTGVPATHYFRSRQEHRVYWGPADGGYVLHSLSAFCEWLASLSYGIFFLTFHPDFESIHVDLHIRLRNHHGNNKSATRSHVDETTPLHCTYSN